MNRMQQTRQCSFIWRLWSLLWTEYGNMPVINCIKKELFIKNFLCKCEQILRKIWICQHLLKKSLIKNFIFVWALPIYSVQSARKNIITGQISIFYVFNFQEKKISYELQSMFTKTSLLYSNLSFLWTLTFILQVL